jgi:hypothetical protein
LLDLARYLDRQRLLRLALLRLDLVRDGGVFLLGRPFPLDRCILRKLEHHVCRGSMANASALRDSSLKTGAFERRGFSEREAVSSVGAWEAKLPPHWNLLLVLQHADLR